MYRSKSVARKAEGSRRERRLRSPAPMRQRLATEPVEEVAGRVRRAALRAANDNEPPHHFLTALGRPVLLALVSATLGDLIAGLLLN